MSDKPSADILNRRRFLGAAGLAGAGAALSAVPALAAEGGKPDPLITEVQDWNRYLGDGVQSRPYGAPSKFEKDVVRRDVAWLTASPESSVNFTPLHELDGIVTPWTRAAPSASTASVTTSAESMPPLKATTTSRKRFFST